MSEIKILKIDETQSKPDASNPLYVGTLSQKLNQTQINNLDTIAQKHRNAEGKVMNLRVEQAKLTFNTSGTTDLKEAVTAIQSWLKELSGDDEKFLQNIREVNKMLSEQTPS